MLTTIQVRAIMHKHSIRAEDMYTNKTTGHTGNIRRVKCYSSEDALIEELMEVAGWDVTVTEGSSYMQRPGITVKCILA